MEEGPARLLGNMRVFCRGRFISGPDFRSSGISLLMILMPSVLWHVEVGVFYAERYTVIFPIIGALLQVSSMFLLLATAFSDPGIVPRQKNYAEQYDERSKSYRQQQPPRYCDVILRGHPFKLKYCITCNIYRPPRSTHCSVCENCIERFDHHCPWLGNCVGKRNYWLFYLFVTTTSMVNVFVLATAAAEIGVLAVEFQGEGHSRGEAFVKALATAPLAPTVAIYCVLIVWFTVGLTAYHNYLICTNQTTYEQIKGSYSNNGFGFNPFHKGLLGNYRDVLCSKVRRRYFDAAEERLRWPVRLPESEEVKDIVDLQDHYLFSNPPEVPEVSPLDSDAIIPPARLKQGVTEGGATQREGGSGGRVSRGPNNVSSSEPTPVSGYRGSSNKDPSLKNETYQEEPREVCKERSKERDERSLGNRQSGVRREIPLEVY